MATYKTHIALKVFDVERSVAFYQALFETPPTKHKVGYAKLDIENPSLNLTLNATGTPLQTGKLSHFGIQVDSADSVVSAIARLKAAGLNPSEEFNTDCCYALQDKAWISDPDGNFWEIFVVHVADTAPELNIDTAFSQPETAEKDYCAPTCCR
ncbi:glyoxalase family protein [Synechococcus sp. PCC 7335]|uniref:ArsI/CadI family heavy metal resistance metalloenzyme n=1 Tax=Synechococcus sp. (strain ATCC 29403 / PCC 7335) TaxID=91464 RepID=UPI00017EB154|nr:ArsI/CadI family heavy metal resistance metalloenzyme [Synechococcus sp. PCC 7335]EDX84880.1 glyoxalase family protein [Synechococcus sp. PCC 7335]